MEFRGSATPGGSASLLFFLLGGGWFGAPLPVQLFRALQSNVQLRDWQAGKGETQNAKQLFVLNKEKPKTLERWDSMGWRQGEGRQGDMITGSF